jgi:phytoene synthase
LSAADLEDLDASVRRNKPDHWLASRFIADAEARADVIALYAFDHELSRAVAMKEPLMAEIRLTWWSEAIGEIFEGKPVRRHPVTLALIEVVRRRNLIRDSFDVMIESRFGLIGAPAHASEASEMFLMDAAIEILDGRGDERAATDAAMLRFGRISTRDANYGARKVPARAFPAIAYAGLKPGRPESLRRRLRLLWIILRGRF